jgi:hypothetical protein
MCGRAIQRPREFEVSLVARTSDVVQLELRPPRPLQRSRDRPIILLLEHGCSEAVKLHHEASRPFRKHNRHPSGEQAFGEPCLHSPRHFGAALFLREAMFVATLN